MEPRGTRRTVTGEWTALVEAELEERGISQRELAKKLGCSQGTISVLLRRGVLTSPYIDEISTMLNINLPPITPLSPTVADIAIRIQELSDTDQQAVQTMVIALSKKDSH